MANRQRQPIERWNRAQLEDRFHAIANEAQALKQNNNRLERDLKILNGRVGGRASALIPTADGPERDEMGELHRANRMLSQKLKVLKHQLLTYTAISSPYSRPRPSTTINKPPATAAGGERQQKQITSAMARRRPQSANIIIGGQPAGAAAGGQQRGGRKGGMPRGGRGGASRPASAYAEAEAQEERPQMTIGRENADVANSAAHSSGFQSRKDESSTYRRWNNHQELELVVPKSADYDSEFGATRSQPMFDGDLNYPKIRELRNQNNAILSENEDLRFSLEKSEKRVTKLRREYDRLVQELEDSQKELSSQSNSLLSVRDEAQRKTESSSKTAEISEKELAIIREENRALKSTNERLITNSLEQENSGKAALAELAHLRAQLQQSSSEWESEHREMDSTVGRLRAENGRLLERLTEMDKEMRTNRGGGMKTVENDKEEISNHDNNKINGGNQKQGNGLENGANNTTQQRLLPKQQQKNREQIIANSSFKNNNYLSSSSSPPTVEMESGEALLNKLVADVMGIVNSHLLVGEGGGQRRNDDNMPGSNFDERQRLQKMYEDVYEELEKVRHLLLNEHKINERLKEQLKLQNAEYEQLKANFEAQIKALGAQLEEKGTQIGTLESQLQTVAATGQIRDGILNLENNARNVASSIESTSLTLHIGKMVLLENGIQQLAGLFNPTFFVAIEFFDFELQTSQLIAGPIADFDFTCAFELTVSDLFIHYLQTEGIAVELYIVRDGVNYELWSQAQITLRKLLSTQTPTHFRGELRFPSGHIEHAVEQQQQQQRKEALASLDYTVQVPFSLLRALSVQRRKMAAAAVIPLAATDSATFDDANELIVHIHRCNGLDKLMMNGDLKQLPTSYVAYQLFNFAVHLSRVVEESANPVFEDSRHWQFPNGSQAVDKYLRGEELQIYVIEDEGGKVRRRQQQRKKVDGSVPHSTTSTALGYLRVPLFPLANNQRIRGTFPLVNQATDSIVSNASLDVSIYWKFAYKFDGLNENTCPLKKFTVVPVGNGRGGNTIVRKNDGKIAVEEKEEENNGQDKQRIREKESNNDVDQQNGNTQIEEQKQMMNSDISSDEDAMLTDEELRKRLFPSVSIHPSAAKTGTADIKGPNLHNTRENVEKLEGEFEQLKRMTATKTTIITTLDTNGMKEGNEEREKITAEKHQNDQSENNVAEVAESPKNSFATPGVSEELKRQQTSMSSADDFTEADMTICEEDGNSSNGEEEQEQEDQEEGEEEECGSVRSDATYTTDGKGIGLLLEEIDSDQKDIIVVADEDIEAVKQRQRGHGHRGEEGETENQQQQKEEEEETGEEKGEEKFGKVPPQPAVRRSLLGELPPIRDPQRKDQIDIRQENQTEIKQEQPQRQINESSSARRTVEFTNPLHSSIPPSDISSSFAEDVQSSFEENSSARSLSQQSSSTASASNDGGGAGGVGNGNGTSSTSSSVSSPISSRAADDDSVRSAAAATGERQEARERNSAELLTRKKRGGGRTTTTAGSRRRSKKQQITIAPAPTTSAIKRSAAPTAMENLLQSQQEEELNELLHSPSSTSGQSNKAIVAIRIGRLRLLEHSPLLQAQFDGANVFVEWNFLDIERELCETEGSFALPRRTNDSVNFGKERVYELDARRIALLRQWTELNIRLTFTLVLDPGDSGELDDLCMGELDLIDVLNSSGHSLIMRNVDNMSIAILEVELEYSTKLMDYIRKTMELLEQEKEDEQ